MGLFNSWIFEYWLIHVRLVILLNERIYLLFSLFFRYSSFYFFRRMDKIPGKIACLSVCPALNFKYLPSFISSLYFFPGIMDEIPGRIACLSVCPALDFKYLSCFISFHYFFPGMENVPERIAFLSINSYLVWNFWFFISYRKFFSFGVEFLPSFLTARRKREGRSSWSCSKNE